MSLWSGATVNPDCITEYKLLNKHNPTYSYIIYKLRQPENEFVVEYKCPVVKEPKAEGGDRQKRHEDKFKVIWDAIPKDECCWVAFEFGYEHRDCPQTKIVLLRLSPDNVDIKQRMTGAAATAELQRKLTGTTSMELAENMNDVDYSTIFAKLPTK